MCQLVFPGVRTSLGSQEQIVYISLFQATGEKWFWWLGQVSLCSPVLLVPLWRPSHASAGMLHLPAFPRP